MSEPSTIVLEARGWRWYPCHHACSGRVLCPPAHETATVTCTSEFNPHTFTQRPAVVS